MIVLVPGPCVSLGVQVNTPLAEPIAALVGALTRLNVSTCAGRSGSVAVLVSVSVLPSLTIWSATGASVGGEFTACTTTTKLCVAVNGGEPLSVTATMIVLVPGPCVSLGVQINTPLAEPI